MFFHNFKYTLKTLFKSKALIFWTYAFPIILGTFFNMAFSNIESSEKLEIIPIAIVENDALEKNMAFTETFKTLSKEGEDQLFNTQYVSESEAIDLLAKKEISGYLLLEEAPKVVVNASGINETILKEVVEEIEQNSKVIRSIATNETAKHVTEQTSNEEIQNIMNSIIEKVVERQKTNQANIENISNSNLSYTMIEFYTLIAMTCLYGGILGMVAVNQNMPNMSKNGKRVSVSPLSKGKLILSSVLASYIVQLIGLLLLFLYTVFVLKVDYGNQFSLLVLLSLVGSFAGLSLGIFVASILKASENTKTGIMISISMLGCFLSGMMGITMKYIIDKNIPLLNKLNPANMITDGFYSLYYYSTHERFYFNVISLLVFSLILIFLSTLSLRRKKYDSI